MSLHFAHDVSRFYLTMPELHIELFDGTPYCWNIQLPCRPPDKRIQAHVNHVGRAIRYPNGIVGTYYTFNRWIDDVPIERNVWYIESQDSSANSWSQPVRVFPEPAALTLDGQPLAEGSALSHVDVASGDRACRLYFSAKDATGASVMATTAAAGSCDDGLFADAFDGCGN